MCVGAALGHHDIVEVHAAHLHRAVELAHARAHRIQLARANVHSEFPRPRSDASPLHQARCTRLCAAAVTSLALLTNMTNLTPPLPRELVHTPAPLSWRCVPTHVPSAPFACAGVLPNVPAAPYAHRHHCAAVVRGLADTHCI
jgi:hypothetical protein